MSSSLSVASASEVDVEHDPTNGCILELSNIVQYLFNNGLLSDIECRKIVIREDEYFIHIHAAIYDVMFTKDSKVFKKILDVFRKMVHPFQNPRILLRIFSYLKFTDIAQCRRAFPCWKGIIDLLVASKYDQVDLEEILLKNLLSKNEKIQNIEHPYRKNEKKSSVFQLMLAINPEKEETILELLQIGRDVPPDDNNGSIEVLCVTENKIDNLIAIALSNRTVLSNVLQFLSLPDIKNCRTVCRTWNAVSEPFLRKISTIKFYSEFGPSQFINVFKFLPLPELPFNAFKFREIFLTRYLLEFFTKFGKNIQCLDLCLRMGAGPCLSQTSNLTELHLQGGWLNTYGSDPNSYVMIPWNNLHSIQTLYLRDTIIEVDKDKEWKRITPLKVHLDHVIFFVDGCYPKEVTFNDYIDFTKVTDVNVNGQCSRQIQKFDWAIDAFHAERIMFSNTRFVNAGTSESAVDYLKLNWQYPLSEKICVSIKQLIIEQGNVSLAALPPSLEKLMIGEQYYSNNDYMESVYLPNLSYLSCRKFDGFNLLAPFYNCPNLSEVEILSANCMNVRLLPRNIKKLKVKPLRYGLLEFTDGLGDDHLNLDLLILSSVAANLLKNFKFDKLLPKVLVLEVSCVYEYEPLVSFIRINKNMEKIYVKFHHRCVFKGSELSTIVDKESEYYEFSNQRGKAITSEEFLTCYGLVDIETDMKGFWEKPPEEERANKQRNDFYEIFNARKRRLRL